MDVFGWREWVLMIFGILWQKKAASSLEAMHWDRWSFWLRWHYFKFEWVLRPKLSWIGLTQFTFYESFYRSQLFSWLRSLRILTFETTPCRATKCKLNVQTGPLCTGCRDQFPSSNKQTHASRDRCAIRLLSSCGSRNDLSGSRFPQILIFRIRGQNLFIPSSDLDVCDDGDQWSGDGDLLDNGVGAWRQRALEELKSGVSRHRMRKFLWIPFCAHFSNIMKRIMIVTKKLMMMAHDIIPSQVFHDGSHDFSHVSQRDLWLLISTYDKFKVIVNLYLSS